jgi:hypothetical protein
MAGDRNTMHSGASPSETSYGERLAIWTLRRIAGGSRSCFAPDVSSGDVPWGQGQDFREVAVAVQVAQDEMRRHGSGRLQLGCSGSLALTQHEQRLLRALAAAQGGDDARVDIYLRKIAPDGQVRQPLAAAVTALAAALAAAGHWLADAVPAWPLPAPALPVAKLHGRTVRAGEVAWP